MRPRIVEELEFFTTIDDAMFRVTGYADEITIQVLRGEAPENLHKRKVLKLTRRQAQALANRILDYMHYHKD